MQLLWQPEQTNTRPPCTVRGGPFGGGLLRGLTMSSKEQPDAVDELAAAEQLQLRKTELACWIDDAWRAVIPYGPEAVIAAIAELVDIMVDKWPEQRKALLQELVALQQQLSE